MFILFQLLGFTVYFFFLQNYRLFSFIDMLCVFVISSCFYIASISFIFKKKVSDYNRVEDKPSVIQAVKNMFKYEDNEAENDINNEVIIKHSDSFEKLKRIK